MRRPEPLKAGDTIRIIAPAGRINPADLEFSMKVFAGWGLSVELGRNMFKSENMFSAGDAERLSDLQDAIDDKNVKAIICARGGYGTNRIIDKVDFSSFELTPKWLVGFSDITVLHSHIQRNFGIETIHGPMGKTINAESTEESVESLRRVLFGETVQLKINGDTRNIPGSAKGVLTGGNLSILYSLIGTPSEPDWEDRILFIEEIGEYHYHFDRMLVAMKRAGIFAKVKGLIVGHLTNMKDPEPGMQRMLSETILEHVSEFGFPVVFNFPAGHEKDNRALVMGREAEMVVGKDVVELSFLEDDDTAEHGFSLRRMVIAGLVMIGFFVVLWVIYSLVLKKYL
jgi:muramoyltetrapeptide carboxypeptidase